MMDIVDRLKAMGGYLDYDCEVTLSSIADEIQTLRAKVASADVLVEYVKRISACYRIEDVQMYAREALATYNKLSEVKE